MTDLLFTFDIFADDKNMFFGSKHLSFHNQLGYRIYGTSDTNSSKFKGTLRPMIYHLNHLSILKSHQLPRGRIISTEKYLKIKANV